MFPTMRSGGNGRVQSGLPCAKTGEASAKHPNIRSEVSLGGMVAPFYARQSAAKGYPLLVLSLPLEHFEMELGPGKISLVREIAAMTASDR